MRGHNYIFENSTTVVSPFNAKHYYIAITEYATP